MGSFWCEENSWLSELALVLMRFDHIASVIVNTNDGIIALQIEPVED
jgi:hypothetical protein